MNDIELMLAGRISMTEFVIKLKTDEKLQNQVRNMIPQEAIDNPEHELWKRIAYSSVKKCNYDYLEFLFWLCRFDGTIGDALNIWDTIKQVYCYQHPEIECTNKYQEAHALYLSAISEYYEGTEVNHLIENMVTECLKIESKGKRIKLAKLAMNELFHTTDRKRPRWIQGAEWPMGRNSPMKFIEQKRFAESVKYYFLDVDTNEMKTIEQWY